MVLRIRIGAVRSLLADFRARSSEIHIWSLLALIIVWRLLYHFDRRFSHAKQGGLNLNLYSRNNTSQEGLNLPPSTYHAKKGNFSAPTAPFEHILRLVTLILDP
ncbi:hypothetical protein BD410DRAFT_389085 [Rickenella mellea]|uniref:Uncharacterized protein n=1 Tax=Rickenella mellea TaxID=50990 RepID=A0A4Y7PX89_9AGAM|nr:hypothetical protein BD410DRAFT_389085 [Rickenella mellea]